MAISVSAAASWTYAGWKTTPSSTVHSPARRLAVVCQPPLTVPSGFAAPGCCQRAAETSLSANRRQVTRGPCVATPCAGCQAPGARADWGVGADPPTGNELGCSWGRSGRRSRIKSSSSANSNAAVPKPDNRIQSIMTSESSYHGVIAREDGAAETARRNRQKPLFLSRRDPYLACVAVGSRTVRSASINSRREVSDQPNSHAARPVIHGEVIAVAGSHKFGRREPGAPTKLALGALAVRARGAVRRYTGIVRVPAIFGPLKDVAQHVVETERVGLEGTDGCRVDVAIVTGEYRPSRIAAGRTLVGHVGPGTCARSFVPGSNRFAAGARGIFPFRGAWQPVSMSGCLR